MRPLENRLREFFVRRRPFPTSGSYGRGRPRDLDKLSRQHDAAHFLRTFHSIQTGHLLDNVGEEKQLFPSGGFDQGRVATHQHLLPPAYAIGAPILIVRETGAWNVRRIDCNRSSCL